mgnify:CR=1 FL=1
MNLMLKSLLEDEDVVKIFDLDGTLSEARWGDVYLNGRHEVNELRGLVKHLEEDKYATMMPTRYGIDAVAMSRGKIIIITRINDGIELSQKQSFVKRAYPVINTVDVIGVKSFQERSFILKNMLKYDSIVYIDDSLENLVKLENKLDGIHLYHTSSLAV